MEKESTELTVLVRVEVKGLPSYRVVKSLSAYFIQAFDEVSNAWLEPGDDIVHVFLNLSDALNCLHKYLENEDFTE